MNLRDYSYGVLALFLLGACADQTTTTTTSPDQAQAKTPPASDDVPSVSETEDQASESQTASPEPASERPRGTQHGKMQCPIALGGIEVEPEEVDGGIALEFSTDDEAKLPKLRKRVEQMALMHGKKMGKGQNRTSDTDGAGRGHGMAGQQGGMGEGKMHGKHHSMSMGQLPAHTATSEPIDDGVRLTMKAVDDAQLEKLRSGVRERAKLMAEGRCPMMESSKKAEPPAASKNPN